MDLFGNKIVKALSWKEPFATLMLHGKIETRTWSTSYRGLVLICSTQSPYKAVDLIEICGEEQLKRINPELLRKNHKFSTCGQAIALGFLAGCRPMVKEDEDKCFVKYREPEINNGKIKRLYCHIYNYVQAIEPMSFKGVQGWKSLTDDEIKKIKVL